MKKIFIITLAFFAISITQANATANVVASTSSATTETKTEFLPIKIEDLPEQVQKNIKKLLYDEGFMLREIFQNKENGDIKVIGVSNEAAVSTFIFDKEGNEKE